MDEFEKAKRLLGKGGYLELEDENEVKSKFYMELLDFESRIDLLKIIKQISDFQRPFFIQLDKEGVLLSVELGYKSLKSSPELKEYSDDDKLKFVQDNILPILQRMIEINDYGIARMPITREVINRAKEMQKVRDSHGKPGKIQE
jgi:hypothetical protein